MKAPSIADSIRRCVDAMLTFVNKTYVVAKKFNGELTIQ